MKKHPQHWQFDAGKLPSPPDYYARQFPGLRVSSGQHAWVTVRCCFHADTQPSLSLHLVSGGFHCFSCGAKGGDVLAFHQKRHGLTFKAAVHALGGLS